MSRKEVLKKVELDHLGQGCWSDSERPTTMFLVVNHEKHTVEMRIHNGPHPHFVAVMNVLIADRDVLKELQWAAKSFRRKYPSIVIGTQCENFSQTYRLFVNYNNVSQTLFERGLCCKCEANIHISCGDTISGIAEMFSGDLLDILAAFFNTSSSDDVKNLLIGTYRKWFKYVPIKKPVQKNAYSVCGILKYA